MSADRVQGQIQILINLKDDIQKLMSHVEEFTNLYEAALMGAQNRGVMGEFMDKLRQEALPYYKREVDNSVHELQLMVQMVDIRIDALQQALARTNAQEYS